MLIEAGWEILLPRRARGNTEEDTEPRRPRYNFYMKLCGAVLLMLVAFGDAQDKPAAPPQPRSVTVPATIDHNRVVIDADLPLPDGSYQRVHAWVDNGNADLEMSRHAATLMGLAVSCDDHGCSAPPPRGMVIGGMSISLDGVKEAKIPLLPVSAAAVMASGMNVEINIPATVLRHFDVLIDFPGRKVSIGAPGTIHFQGPSGKVLVNADNGLIQIPSRIEKKKYNLALDLGASISFLSTEVFDPITAAHPDWPHMTGAVGSANMWGGDDETNWKVMRLDRVQYGPLFLTDVPFVDFPKDRVEFFEKRAGIATAGLIGSNVLLNYRVGIDYVHSIVYFDLGRTYRFPDFTVVGLTLRPENDGRFTVLAVVDAEGTPSVPQGPEGVQAGDHLRAVDGIPVQGSTMGQVWSMLGGTVGQERRLTLERAGKEFAVTAKVREFLQVAPDGDSEKKSRR